MKNIKNPMKSTRIRDLAIPLLIVLVGGGIVATLAPAMASAQATTSLQVQTANPQVYPLGSAIIQAQLQHGTPSSSYTVTVQVAGPSGAGGPFCETVSITTNGAGNGQVVLQFPGTFSGSSCSPAGTGGPSTELAGTYTVTVSSNPAITTGTLSTTFGVQAAPNLVSGAGTISTQATTTITYIPAPGSTTSSPLFVSCNGTTSSPTATTAPYYASQVGSIEITGVITSNTPGQVHFAVLRSPCTPSPTSTFASTIIGYYTFSNVTITLPNGRPVTGGLQIVQEGTANSLTTTSGTTTTTVGVGQSHLSITGTGDLAGLTGLANFDGTAVTVGTSITSFQVYTAQLTFPSYN